MPTYIKTERRTVYEGTNLESLIEDATKICNQYSINLNKIQLELEPGNWDGGHSYMEMSFPRPMTKFEIKQLTLSNEASAALLEVAERRQLEALKEKYEKATNG